MIETKQPKCLKDIFQDISYAWDLLEAEVKLETSQSQAISGEDISNLLQLYMRGVEKMNTLIDIRQSFFKNRVTNLMSRPSVIKILTKPMTKKSQPSLVSCTSPESSKNIKQKQQIFNSQSPKRLDAQKQLQLKQKKQSLQMRLAYSAEQNNPDVLRKMLAEHSQKETIMSQKIEKIVDSHEQRLKKRINERKLKTLTSKSKSQMVMENQIIENIVEQYAQVEPKDGYIKMGGQVNYENDQNQNRQGKQSKMKEKCSIYMKNKKVGDNFGRKHKSMEGKRMGEFGLGELGINRGKRKLSNDEKQKQAIEISFKPYKDCLLGGAIPQKIK